MPSASPPTDARLASLRSRIDAALPDLVAGRTPSSLYAPVEYVLQGGGKRLRPIVLLLVSEAFGTSTDRAFPAALAVEVFHNFTLVHDDIMDDAPERRGRPTVHTRWDVNTAILAGDLMMGLSYRLLSSVDDADHQALFGAYHPMVEELCRGQALDDAFESRDDVSVEDYIDMIDGKTGALLAAIFEMGAILGNASLKTRRILHTAGLNLGRAFQIRDDLLDVVADSDDWGKTVGGDLVVGKRTFLTLHALQHATGDAYDWFARLTNGGLPPEDVPEARDRMSALGTFDAARTAIATYSDTAREALSVLPQHLATDTLHALVHRLETRQH